MNRRTSTSSPTRRRRGATVVEMAVVLPVFGLFMAGLMEVGHAYLIMHMLNSAAKQSARLGAVEGNTTTDVIDSAETTFGAAFDASRATVYVKDGSSFDSPGFDPETIEYTTLPDIEVSTAESGQLFIVRLEVNYDDVSLLPPFWIRDVTLNGQSVMRHE